MSRALLDEHVPGWEALSLLQFRAALQGVAGRHRVALRAAFDAARVPVIALPPAPPEPAPIPAVVAKPPKRGPGVLTPSPAKR